jgi:hypothetical protein
MAVIFLTLTTARHRRGVDHVVSRCPTYALAIRAPEHLYGDKTQKLNKISYYGVSLPHRHQTKFHHLGNSYII